MKNISVALLFSVFFWACSSQVAFSTKKPADVDSVLFYQQKDIVDPFIDSIFTDPGNSAQISVVLVPPPPVDVDLPMTAHYRIVDVVRRTALLFRLFLFRFSLFPHFT